MAKEKPTAPTPVLETNRGRDYKRSDDNVKNISVGLMDMDSAIMYYFDNVIRPRVEESGEQIRVPIMYGSPERWASVRRTGYIRDKKRQILTPVIMFKRTSMTKNESIPLDKLDANNPKLHYTFEKKWTQKNRYDKFTAQQKLIPQNEFYNVTLPDYMTLTYNFIIWTAYTEQMNKIVEKVNYSVGSYWGAPDKMKFKTVIDSFSDVTEMSDTERVVKTEFDVTLNGYLIPKSFNNKVTTQKYITPKRVVVKEGFM
jgi:hypothetical protein